MKLCYIGGPFSPKPGRPVENNCRRAEEIACKLVELYGDAVHPVVPHSAGRVLFGIQSERAAIAGTLELMRRCDALLLVPGWKDSDGTQGEVKEALAKGIPVFDLADLSGKPPTKFGRWLASGEHPQGKQEGP